MGTEVIDESRKCPMCGHATWTLLDGYSTLQALEGGLQALAYSCDQCGFIRWHRMDMTERPSWTQSDQTPERDD
jgi:ribosomal protein S27AE